DIAIESDLRRVDQIIAAAYVCKRRLFLPKYHIAANYILKFARIAMPLAVHQPLDSRLGESRSSPVEDPVVALNEIIHQEGNVGPAFSQCWQVDRNAIQPVEEVLPEKTAAHI